MVKQKRVNDTTQQEVTELVATSKADTELLTKTRADGKDEDAPTLQRIDLSEE